MSAVAVRTLVSSSSRKAIHRSASPSGPVTETTTTTTKKQSSIGDGMMQKESMKQERRKENEENEDNEKNEESEVREKER